MSTTNFIIYLQLQCTTHFLFTTKGLRFRCPHTESHNTVTRETADPRTHSPGKRQIVG